MSCEGVRVFLHGISNSVNAASELGSASSTSMVTGDDGVTVTLSGAK